MNYIAVSLRTHYLQDREEMRDALDQRMTSFITACGLIPVLIPNELATAKNIVNTLPISGILLSGGNTTKERDETEHYLIHYALQKNLPLLGICHGMQMIQAHFGIMLQPTPGHIAKQQEILIESAPITVNSYHHIGTQESIPELKVWARAYDGVVKAVQHITLPIAGIMWHPERMQPFLHTDILRCQQFFKGEAICAPLS